MRYTAIPQTALTPSSICLGTADFGVKNTEGEAHALADRFVECGGTFFDTARIYSNWAPGELNRSERILGDWLRDSGMRDKVIVATKGAHPNLDTMLVPRMSQAEVQGDLDGSLVSLRVECIDLYYLHRDDPARPVEEMVDMLDRFVDAGKIRYYACSNWQPHRVEAACMYARSKGTRGFVANQMLWNAGSRHMRPSGDPTVAVFDHKMREVHKRLPIVATPWSSQANGFFSKVAAAEGGPNQTLPAGNYDTAGNLAVYEVIKSIAARHHLSIAQVVLLYLLEQDIPTIPIIGSRTIAQLESSMRAADARLEAGDVARIEEATTVK